MTCKTVGRLAVRDWLGAPVHVHRGPLPFGWLPPGFKSRAELSREAIAVMVQQDDAGEWVEVTTFRDVGEPSAERPSWRSMVIP